MIFLNMMASIRRMHRGACRTSLQCIRLDENCLPVQAAVH
jgi:hypothetical protein